MVFTAILQQIDSFQEQIAEHQQLGNELLKKIQYRFRLDWNYHSNALEGNSLTRQETRSVMVNNITLEGKPLKDVLEMSGHDNVIKEVLRIGKGDARLSEKRIKEIHKALIYDEKPENQSKIGQWKTIANHVINYKGEKFDYSDPHDVAEEVHKLLDEVNAAIDKKSVHPVLLAFQFHLKYLTIHPFYDGNGRTARILMNLLLIASGYPPVVIKLEEKEPYNRFLADIQCYGGEPDLLYDFLGKLMLRSQQLVLDAIEGKDISEPDDFEKELALIEQRVKLEAQKSGEVIKKSEEAVKFVLQNVILKLEEDLSKKLEKVNRLFVENFIQYESDRLIYIDDTLDFDETIYSTSIADLEESLRGSELSLNRVQLTFYWNGSKISGEHIFDLKYWIAINFSEYNYNVHYADPAGENSIITLLYSQKLSELHTDLILNHASDYVLSSMKQQYKSHTGEDL